MISTVALFWALLSFASVNMARYFSSLRALLVVLRNCDPLLYQYVDGGGFFTSHCQPNKQVRLVWYIYAQRYRDHHDDEFIRRCEPVRRQFILTSALCGLVVVSLIALMIWH
ncbi:universal stress protein UspB [Escherichia coli]